MLSGTVDRKRPVLLSKTADFIRRAADKVALVVMDGMSFENLFTIQRDFADQDFSFSTNASFSFFPTVTAVARQSVFSGKLPSEHAKPFSLDNEERQWIEFWKNEGFAESEVFFHKGIVDALPANTKVAGIVVNIVDDLMHSELQGFLGIQHGLSDWVQNGSLATMLRMFIDNGYTVFMTSDHGNTSAIAKGRFQSLVCSWNPQADVQFFMMPLLMRESLINSTLYGILVRTCQKDLWRTCLMQILAMAILEKNTLHMAV